MRKKRILLPVVILSTTYLFLFLLFLFRFYLRLQIPTTNHYSMHLLIVVLIGLDVYLVILIAIRLNIKYQLRPFAIIGFIGLSGLFFDRLSNREDEISQYFNKNEKYLTTLIQHDTMLDSHSPTSYDTVFISKCKDQNLRSYYKGNDITYINLFGFSGYGYGLAYTKKYFPKGPAPYRKSPIVNWFEIKANWYYFSYFD